MAKDKGMGMGEMIYNDLSKISRIGRGQAIQSTYSAIKTDPVVSGIKLPDRKTSEIKLPDSTISGIKLKE
jgi:hypothetical protein